MDFIHCVCIIGQIMASSVPMTRQVCLWKLIYIEEIFTPKSICIVGMLTWSDVRPHCPTFLNWNSSILFDVDFSLCWLNLEASWFSLEQNSCWSCRQAFIYFSRIHHVWKGTEKNCTYMESNRLTEHAQSLLGGVKRENSRKGEIGKWKNLTNN